MNNILIVVVLAALVLGGVGFWVNNQNAETVALQAQETNDTSDTAESPEAEGMSVVGQQTAIAPGGFVWEFKDTGVATEYGAPVMSVKLTYNGKTYDFSGYEGSCFDVKGSAWSLVEGELAGAICYFAGGGYEIGIFSEGGKMVAKKGVLSEGDAETPSFRGDFTQLLVLE